MASMHQKMDSMTSSSKPDWQKCIRMDEGQRTEALVEDLNGLGHKPQTEREASLRKLVVLVSGLDDVTHAAVAKSRAEALLALDTTTGQEIGRSYETMWKQLPGELAYREVSGWHSATREMSIEQQERLEHILPMIMGEKPDEVSVDPAMREVDGSHGLPAERWARYWDKRREGDQTTD